jgi:hypothetical protein
MGLNFSLLVSNGIYSVYLNVYKNYISRKAKMFYNLKWRERQYAGYVYFIKRISRDEWASEMSQIFPMDDGQAASGH